MMTKKIILLLFIVLSLFMLSYIIYIIPSQHNIEPMHKVKLSHEINNHDANNLLRKNQNAQNTLPENDFSIRSNTDKTIEPEKAKKIAGSKSADEIESIFIFDKEAINMSSVEAIKDKEIFNLSIDAMELESQKSTTALNNRSKFLDIFSDKQSNFLQDNEDSLIELNNVQCGQSSCLALFNSDDMDSFNQFYADFSATENNFYASSIYSYVNEFGGFSHRIFISMDENINTIFIPDTN